MTQKQKILGATAVLLLIIALTISMAPDGFLERSGSTGSASFGSYTTESMPIMMDSFDASAVTSAGSAGSPMMTQRVPAKDGTEFGEKIIKHGSLTMQVESMEEAVVSIVAIAKTHGGNVTDQSVSQYSITAPRDGSLSVRVAADQFDAAMSDIKAVAQEVRYETVSTDDVTSEYVDLEARLSNAYAEEASYVAVLTKATTVEDILKVQSYLSQVRGEIESMEAQKKYLDSQTTYSTIEISLTEDSKVTFSDDSFRPWQAVVDAAQTVVEGFQAFVLGFIRLVIVGGAILVPVAIIWFLGRAIYRRARK